jgi:hypothetical protein
MAVALLGLGGIMITFVTSATSTQLGVQNPNPSSPSSTAPFCGGYRFLSPPEGIYAVSAKAAFVLDMGGTVWYCTSSGNNSIASGPGDTFGLGGIKVGGLMGTVLAVMSYYNQGFWLCFNATSVGCSVESQFISLPRGFCFSLSLEECYPVGISLDKKLNVYFTDGINKIVGECTYASGYKNCTVLESLSDSPYGIYLDNSKSPPDIWVTDSGCSGNVWKNGVLQYSLLDSVEGITISNSNPTKSPHLYLAITAKCGFYSAPFIFDVTDGQALFTPLSSPSDIPAISTKLQFTTGCLSLSGQCDPSAGNMTFTLKDTV